jgi:hypothetical protein
LKDEADNHLIELVIAENVRFLFAIAPHPFFKNGDRMVFGEVVDCDRTDRPKSTLWDDKELR